MNSKADKPGSMDRLFSGLMQVNQQREQVPQGTGKEETSTRLPDQPSQQKAEEVVFERPVAEESKAQGSKRRGKNGREQFLFRVDEELILKTRHISNQHGISICDIINYALKNFLNSYENKYGVIKKKGNRTNVENLL